MKWRIDKDGYVYNEKGNKIGVTRTTNLPEGRPLPIYELPKRQPTPEFVQDMNARKMKDTSGMSFNKRIEYYESEFRFFSTMLIPKAALNFLRLAILARIEKIKKRYC